jgi:hypothetical protein
MSTFQYYNWEEVNINWENVNMKWEEVGFLIGKVLPIIGMTAPLSPYPQKRKYNLEKVNELPEEKKRKIIKIVCKIQGEEDEYINYKYGKSDDIKITAEDIDIIINELFKNKIKVNVYNISR